MENINSTGMMSLVEEHIGDFGLDEHMAIQQAARTRAAEVEAAARASAATRAAVIQAAINISPEYYDAA